MNIAEIKDSLLNVTDLDEVHMQLISAENKNKNDLLDLAIQKIRFYIVSNNQREAKKQLVTVSDRVNEMTDEQLYFYYKFKGNLKYSLGNYKSALTNYQLSILYSRNISTVERADLHYSIGISATQTMDTETATAYTESALSFYKELKNSNRIIECTVNLGIIKSRNGHLKSSLEHFEFGYKMIGKSGAHPLSFIVCYNYAYLLLQFHNYGKAIKLFKESLMCLGPKKELQSLLCCVGIMRSYISLYQKDKALDWLKISNTFINGKLEEQLMHNDQLVEFYVIEAYLKEDFAKYESLILNKLFPMIKKTGHDMDLIYYNKQLADFYWKQGQSQKAFVMIEEISTQFASV